MANLVINPTDARTFVQFCDSLSKKEWVDLHGELMQRLKRSAQCIYKWKNGLSIPSSIMERKAISDHINKKYQTLTRHWTLFPDPQS